MSSTTIPQSNGHNYADKTGSITALAEDVVKQSKALTDYLQANNFPQPNFASNSIARPETDEYAELHSKLKRSVDSLQYLVEGPKRHFRALVCQGYELASIQVALDFNFFTLVPAQGQISMTELAKQAGIDLDRASRIIRLLATEFIFTEPEPGYVAHNPSSYLLHTDEEIRATLHYTLDEMLKAAAYTSDYVKESPLSYDSALTPFSMRHKYPIYEFYTKDPKRSQRFAKAMAGWSKLNLNLNALQEFFPWQNLKGTVVDVGGGSGKVSITLAKSFPALKFIVQDSADMHTAGQELLTTADLRQRVRYMQHSFFGPQPVGGPEIGAFMMRNIALNWCDADVVSQFRGIVPGLERSPPETPLLINEIVMPEADDLALELGLERGLRQIDIIMLVCFGGKLRTPTELEKLLKAADERYEVKSARFEGLMGLLEVYLRR